MKQIKLSQGLFALVDDEDYEWLIQWKWSAQKIRHTYYAARRICLPNGKQSQIRMHRFILGLEPGDKRQVDHRNHNGLDNQRKNLRLCTNTQNHQNSNSYRNGRSIYKGLYWHIQNENWVARIKVKGKYKHLGSYSSEIEAAKAYDNAAQKYFGEYAKLNISEKQ